MLQAGDKIRGLPRSQKPLSGDKGLSSSAESRLTFGMALTGQDNLCSAEIHRSILRRHKRNRLTLPKTA